MKGLNKTIVVLIALFCSGNSYSQKTTEFFLVPGAQFSDYRNNSNAAHYLGYGMDMTITFPSKNFLNIENPKHAWLTPLNPWISAGVNFTKKEITDFQGGKTYIEAGFWYIINLGAGYTWLGKDESNNYYYHAFVGIPVPILLNSDNSPNCLLVEPYARFKFSPDFPCMELGLLVKYAFHIEIKR